MTRLLCWWLGGTVLAAVTLGALPGRPSANEHPEVRGGGDWGFGGLDFYGETRST